VISDAAYTALSAEAQRRSVPSGVLGEALYLYQKNYTDLHVSNSALTDSDIERTCLLPTTIDSVLEGAQRQFKNNAIVTTRKERIVASVKSVATSLTLGVISNVIFVMLMLIFYVVARDTAPGVLKSIGIELAADAQQPALENTAVATSTRLEQQLKQPRLLLPSTAGQSDANAAKSE
jgi:hypothetical protein